MKTKTQRHQTLAVLISAVRQVCLLDGASFGARIPKLLGWWWGGLPVCLRAAEALEMLSCTLRRAGLSTVSFFTWCSQG